LDNDYNAAPTGTGDDIFPKNITEAVTRVNTYRPKIAPTTTKREYYGRNSNSSNSQVTKRKLSPTTSVTRGSTYSNWRKSIECESWE
jgi:hypothetical protein